MKEFISIFVILMLTACGADKRATDSAEYGHGVEADATIKGPHRRRLLNDGDFAIEVVLFEDAALQGSSTNSAPHFRVYATQSKQPIEPGKVKLNVELTRLGGRVERFAFAPEHDYLKGQSAVREPHSFDVKIDAEYAGKRHSWNYPSYEGRTSIAPQMAAAAGIKTAVAAPGVLRETLALYGSIQPDAERVRNVVARFPGPIRSVAKPIGASVKVGETLAVIESNESLQTYALSAPIAGIITQRNANPGEVAGAETLFEIVDFSQVWAELNVFARDRARLRVGQTVAVNAADGRQNGTGKIVSIAPIGNAGSVTARVLLDNRDSLWTPGTFVAASVTIGERAAPLLVANSALQSFRDFSVVFAKVGDVYEVRMLELGGSDGEVTEVLGGLQPGTTYVTDNSYLIKADIEKSGAEHDH